METILIIKYLVILSVGIVWIWVGTWVVSTFRNTTIKQISIPEYKPIVWGSVVNDEERLRLANFILSIEKGNPAYDKILKICDENI